MRLRMLQDGPRIPSLVLFGLFAVSLLGGILAIIVNLSAERQERAQVQLTSEIMFVLRQSGRALIDAETGQRGYVITGDPAYLAPYYTGSRDFPVTLERLESLMEPVATERQRQLLETMRSRGNAKLQELASTVELIESGSEEAALALIETDDGRASMVAFRQTIGELELIERDILAEANRTAIATENRIVPILFALLIVMLLALALGLWQIFRTARAEAEARTAHSLAEARDRADLLSRELNHRVKNLFAVILAIVRMSLRGETDPQVASAKITERINALSVAHSVTQGQLETPVANLEDLVRTATAPYLDETRALAMAGPQTMVIAKQITPLGLILHELVTNCVKYGAWSRAGGLLDVRWETIDGPEPAVRVAWTESAPGFAGEAGPDGFGSRMIEASARQLEGSVRREFGKDGLEVVLTFRHLARDGADETL